MVVDCRDPDHWHIYFYGNNERETTRLLQRLLHPGDVMLDIGANAGYFSLLASDLGCAAHAFEPQPRITELLRQSVTLSRANVDVVEAACGDTNGTTTLFMSSGPEAIGLATLTPGMYSVAAEPLTVTLVTVDSYCAENKLQPKLLKIDVEGHEFHVLEGARQTLMACRPHIVCEVKDPRASDLLESLGYAGRPLERDNVHFAPPGAHPYRRPAPDHR
jgi:FkbM family methyltransferase